MLKARYFKEVDLLTAEILKRSFFTWHSIVHGRDLLKEGLIWHVGDGSTIKVWTDNSIPMTSLRKPYGHKPYKIVTKVNELLLQNGEGWNIDKLNEVFNEEDVADILRVPVGRVGNSDYVARNYTKKWHLFGQVCISP
jgi:hypothetical protein